MSQIDSRATTRQDNPHQECDGDMTRRQFFTAAAVVLAMSLPGEGRGEQPARAAAADQALPPFLELVTNQGKPPSKRELAEKSIIKLNAAMNELYATTLTFSKRNFRDQFPIIIALFSGQGGQMILYSPGKAPIVADRVPVAYELAKSVSHSPMALYQIVVPYLKDPKADSSWKGPMRTFRTQNQTALDNVEALDLAQKEKGALAGILKRNIGFMDHCLERGTYTYAELEEFAYGLAPLLEKSTWLAGNTQVTHWMKILDDWRRMLGKDWDCLYAVTNTLYVTRAGRSQRRHRPVVAV